ncbi:sensor histidine kinase [Paenibacillus radicis (ex Xue et al. 2023)]|uniref:histidine kinase n=1 Tax=Paenibacillus radicis (ex Xue et al. 2023) TaxID=2972489 RepID=A0ABT1YFH0_9BACL|nr:HAMP domain-containing sensor histidine kinase [Paenibacillus radicis (ex Xue et al. 2023)]MCR8631926.1 HAMP domain-containing histidine kinase [Paenibacillus radicis (ex Xue et al. 2023)]
MLTSVFRKQLLSLLCVLLVGFTLIALVLNFALQDFLVKQKEALLFREGEQLNELLLEGLSADPSNQKTIYNNADSRLKRTLNIRTNLLLIDESAGVNKKRLEKRLLKQSEIKDPALLSQVLKGGRVTQIGPFTYSDDTVLLSVGMPVIEKDKVIGALFLHTPVQEIQMGKVTRLIIFTAYLIAIPFSLLVFVLSKRMTGPLLRMNRAAKRLGNGDFTVRVPVESRDEVSQLADTFNQMAEQLEQLDRMRKELIANVSHELRTPLTSVRGFAQGLMEGVIPEEQHHRYHQIIYAELFRLTSLLNTMLDLSAIETGRVNMEMKAIRWSSLVHTVSESLAPRIEKKELDVEIVEPEDEILKAYGDPERLKQVLFNLLDNAIRHSESGGKITIQSYYEQDSLVVKVSDTGSGIDPSKLPYIWERFYTEDDSRHTHRERSGLGLTITKQLLELMKGSIEVDSVLEKGTTFTIRIPTPPET